MFMKTPIKRQKGKQTRKKGQGITEEGQGAIQRRQGKAPCYFDINETLNTAAPV